MPDVDLTPTSPTLSALFTVIRGLIASIGVLGTIWGFVSAKDLTGLWEFFHTSTFNSFVAAIAAAICLAWGFYREHKGTTERNSLKAAVDPSTGVQAIVPPGSNKATIVSD